MRTTLIAALLLLTATPALAEADWVNLGQTEDGTVTVYIDGSSIRTSGAIRRYWERTDLVKHPNGWKQTKALWESNCATGHARLLQVIVYNVDGTIDAMPAAVGPWNYVTPDTAAETVHNYVCGK